MAYGSVILPKSTWDLESILFCSSFSLNCLYSVASKSMSNLKVRKVN